MPTLPWRGGRSPSAHRPARLLALPGTLGWHPSRGHRHVLSSPRLLFGLGKGLPPGDPAET